MQFTSQSSRRQLLQLATATSLSLLAGAKPSFAASPLDAPFDRLVKSHGFTAGGPGLAVLVQQKDQPPFMRCVGLATLHDKKAVTPKTMFELASVSKSMTATAILVLHEQKKLNVADDIRKHLPEIPDYNPKRPITIADMMQHISGLASYLDFEHVPAKNKDNEGNPYWLSSDYVGEFARQKIPLDFATGKKYEYNNTNYTLLAVIIERLTGKSFGKFMREAIFDPAGMKTAFVNEGPGSVPTSPDRVDAVGYELEKGQLQEAWGTPPHRHETLLTVGDGAIWCSLEDMAAWDTALQTNKLVRPSTMQMAHMPSKTDDGEVNPYGFGWRLYYKRPEKLNGYGHTGYWGGFRTYYYRDLNANRTIVFLGNGHKLDGDKFWEDLTKAVEQHKLK